MKSVVPTATMPHGEAFWKELYGEDVHCQLGFFHLLQRIYDTLDRRSNLFGKCLLALKECIYRYDPADWTNLIEALKAGRLSIDGKECADDDIDEMRCTKVFARRYGKRSSKKSFTAKFKFNPTLLLGLRSGSLRRIISTDVYFLTALAKLQGHSLTRCAMCLTAWQPKSSPQFPHHLAPNMGCRHSRATALSPCWRSPMSCWPITAMLDVVINLQMRYYREDGQSTMSLHDTATIV